MIDANAQTINDVPMDATTMGTINKLMSEYKPKPNPRYNAGYHTLAILARHVVTNINTDPKFGEAALKFLNIAPIIQLHLSSSDKGGNLAVTGFTSKYPPDFKGTVGLDASKVYAATGTNGRVTFAYNGGGDTDTDVEPSSAVEPSINKSATDIEAQPTRSNITARGEKKEKPQTDNAALGRKRR
jgi:hypothetical protein